MARPASGLYQLGPYRINLAQRLVTCRGTPVALPPKTFDLLLLLIENQDRALTKEEIIQSLWPESFVEEGNLKFQISTLRKALGDPAAGWIDTIPKHGYRLRAPVSALDSTHAPAPEPHPRRKHLWWAAAAAVVLCVAGLFLAGKRLGNTNAPATSVPLTAYPGLELHPSLSPDGSQVAFAWDGPHEDNFDVYVKLVGPGEPIRLTSHPLPEFSPAWSPDGRWIAFLRGPLDSVVGVYVVAALGGSAERKITDIVQPHANFINRSLMPNANLTWTPDSRSLIVTGQFSRGERTALWLVPLETGPVRRLTHPPEKSLGDFGPAISPNGQFLAFVRVHDMAVNELSVVPLSADFTPTAPPRGVMANGWAMESPAWMADSRRVVFSSGPALGLRRLMRLAVSQNVTKPETITIGEDGTAISLSPAGRIVYSRQLRDNNIWEMDLERPGAAPKRVIASTRDDYTPSYSPDGTKIAFGSTRSGSDEVWIAGADGSNPKQFTSTGGTQTGNPQWSPDGTTLVFNSRRGGSSHLYLLDPSTGQIRQLSQDDGIEPRWSRDGKWIYFVSNRTGRNEVWRMPREGGAAARVTKNGGSTAQESPDGKSVYFAKGSALWRIPTGGGAEMKIADDLSYQSNFDVGAGGIYFMATRGSKRLASIRYYDFSTGKVSELLDTGRRWWIGVAIARDGRHLLYSVVDSEGSDLMLAEEFR